MTRSTSERGEQRMLFRLEVQRSERSTTYSVFDVSPDDRRFVFLRTVADSSSERRAPVLIVVENWLEEVKAKVKQ